MTESKKIIDALLSLLKDKRALSTAPEDLKCIEGFEELYGLLYGYRESFVAISKGDLSEQIKGKGYLCGALKSLQSSLKHLTWQTKRIAEGDFTHKVDFLGEFSEAFNEMALQLEIQVSIIEQTKVKLKESEENFRQITESMEEVFWLSDSSGKILYISPAYKDVWEAEGIKAKTVQDLLLGLTHPSDQELVSSKLEEYNSTEQFDLEFRLKFPNNKIKYVSVRLRPIKNGVKGETRHSGIVQDITVRALYQKRMLESLVQAENAFNQLKESQGKVIELEKKNAVLAMTVTANHEMNQPLTVLKGNLELLKERLANPDYDALFQRLNAALSKIESTLIKLRNIDTVKMRDYVDGINMIDIRDTACEDL